MKNASLLPMSLWIGRAVPLTWAGFGWCLSCFYGQLAGRLGAAWPGMASAGVTLFCSMWSVMLQPPSPGSKREWKHELSWGLGLELAHHCFCHMAKESQRAAQVHRWGSRIFSMGGVKKSLCKGHGYEKGVENWGHFCHQPTTSTILDIFPLRKK